MTASGERHTIGDNDAIIHIVGVNSLAKLRKRFWTEKYHREGLAGSALQTHFCRPVRPIDSPGAVKAVDAVITNVQMIEEGWTKCTIPASPHVVSGEILNLGAVAKGFRQTGRTIAAGVFAATVAEEHFVFFAQILVDAHGGGCCGAGIRRQENKILGGTGKIWLWNERENILRDRANPGRIDFVIWKRVSAQYVTGAKPGSGRVKDLARLDCTATRICA